MRGIWRTLTDLRNQLEAALSRTAQEGAEASLPTVGALVERLKALHAAHTLEAAPERAAPRRTATVEEAITTRIRQREQAEAVPQPDDSAGAGGSSNARTAACHRAGASGHACPGTPGTLDASAAVAPVLGTAGVAGPAPRAPPIPPAGAWAWGGSPRRPGRPPQAGVVLSRSAGWLGLHLSRCGLSSLLAKASQCNAAGLLRQGPASLRSVLRSLDTHPAALATRRKEGRKDKTAEGQPRERPSDPVARV